MDEKFVRGNQRYSSKKNSLNLDVIEKNGKYFWQLIEDGIVQYWDLKGFSTKAEALKEGKVQQKRLR